MAASKEEFLNQLSDRATKNKKVFKNKEELEGHIHHIHNFLRNNGFGYNMEAMKTFILFYCLKLIDDKIEAFADINLKKLKDEPDGKNTFTKAKEEFIKYCKFSDFLKKKYEIDTNILYIHIKNTIKCLKRYFNEIIPTHLVLDLETDKYLQLIMLVNDIDTKNTEIHVSGKIYEYFIGRDETAISELGAYFTARDAICCIFELDMPKLKQLEMPVIMPNEMPAESIKYEVPTMGDPFGGSGGFTCGYAEIIDKELKEKSLSWTPEMVNKIKHFDINDDVIKLARIELFAITGIFPELDNFKRGNTFQSEFTNSNGIVEYWDYLYSNCPFGGDKTKQTEEMKKNNKILKFLKDKKKELEKGLSKEQKKKWNNIKLNGDTPEEQHFKHILKQITKHTNENKKTKLQLDASKIVFNNCSQRIQKATKNFGIHESKINNKEAASMVLFMDLLAPNGKCRAVFKEGIFFDGIYSEIREVLIKKFNVRYVLSIPVDSFSNTKTKTSVIYFDNDGKQTSEVIFYEIKVDKEPDDVIIFNETTNEYELVKDKGTIIGKPKLIEVSRASYIDLIRPTRKRKSSKASRGEFDDIYLYSLNGKDYVKDTMQVKTGWSIKLLGDIIEYRSKTKLPADTGKDIGKYRFYRSSNNIQYSDICDITDKLYIILGNGGEGCLFIDNQFSCSDHVFVFSANTELLNLYLYYYLKSIWNKFIKKLFNGSTLGNINKTNLDNYKIPIPDKFTPELIKLLNDMKEQTFKIRDNKETIPHQEIIIKDKIIELLSNGVKGKDYLEDTFYDLCNYNFGKTINKENRKGSKYPYIVVGGIDGYVDDYLYDGENICFMCVGSTLGTTSFYNEKIYPSTHILCFNFKNNKNNKYLYYYIKYIFNYDKLLHGSTVPQVNKTDIDNELLKVLSNENIKKHLEPLFNKIEKLETEIKDTSLALNQTSTEFSKLLDKYVSYEIIERPVESAISSDNEDEDEEIESETEGKESKKIVKAKKTITKTTTKTTTSIKIDKSEGIATLDNVLGDADKSSKEKTIIKKKTT